MPQIIGLVGEIGSGKGSFAKIFQNSTPNKKIGVIKFSDVLSDILKTLHLPKTRHNLQILKIAIDKHFDKQTFSQAVKKKIKTKLQQNDILIIDGLRWPEDEKMIKNFKNHLIIYITATPQIRYHRVKQRKEKKDEQTMTWEQFLTEDQKINERYIPQIGKNANYIIENNQDWKDFEKKSLEIIKKILCA